MNQMTCNREHDFTLVLTGFIELTDEIEDALLRACDDATLAMRSGRPFLTFSRQAPSMKDAILSAIHDVHGSALGIEVLRVDYCSLVTQSDIARRINKSRQMVYQYARGIRGPGRFPSPVCELGDGQSLWLWCEVSYWLWHNNMIRESEYLDAEEVDTINAVIDFTRKMKIQGELTRELIKAFESFSCCEHPTGD